MAAAVVARLFDNSRITQVRHLSDFLIIVVIPALIVSIGWALRYILAGTR